MQLDRDTIAGLAEHLERCQLEARDTPKITDEHTGMDWEDAYAIQTRSCGARSGAARVSSATRPGSRPTPK